MRPEYNILVAAQPSPWNNLWKVPLQGGLGDLPAALADRCEFHVRTHTSDYGMVNVAKGALIHWRDEAHVHHTEEVGTFAAQKKRKKKRKKKKKEMRLM